jgi:FlaA1/EpsC-like NDP-sugar epimerase
MNEVSLELFLATLPIALVGTYVSFFIFGVYRGVWRYVGVDDLMRYAKATGGSVLLIALAVTLLNTIGPVPPRIFILFAVFLFLSLAASRSSFKVLDQIYGHQKRDKEERVLIIGAGDAGEMAVRWILMNPHFGYRPVGFLDEDPFNAGREIHGVDILGGYDQLDDLLGQKSIDGVVLTVDGQNSDDLIEMITNVCHAQGCWVRTLRLEFELVE